MAINVEEHMHQHCMGVRCRKCGETVCEDEISLNWCEYCWATHEPEACGNYSRQGTIEDQYGDPVDPESCFVCGMMREDHVDA
jgi:hypothetical protein